MSPPGTRRRSARRGGVDGHERNRVRDPGSVLPDPGHPGHHGVPPLRDGLAVLQAPGAKAAPAPFPQRLPRVTVQLPDLQRDVRGRPAARVGRGRSATRRTGSQIQVLDDSTDETTAIASRAVEHYRALGLRHRLPAPRPTAPATRPAPSTPGSAARPASSCCIFDADFVAPPDVLEKTLGHFDDPKVGMVQARWGHINRDYSLLTEVQSIMLDGHFIMEHGARSRSGRFFNFNGTAGRVAPRGDRRRRAAGSTTPSPRTSTSATARSCGAGASSTCPTSWRRPSCRSR